MFQTFRPGLCIFWHWCCYRTKWVCCTGDQEQGCHVWHHSGSDWLQKGQIRDFFRSDFRTFWRTAPKCPEIWSEKSPGFVQFGVQSYPLWSQTYHLCVMQTTYSSVVNMFITQKHRLSLQTSKSCLHLTQLRLFAVLYFLSSTCTIYSKHW